MPSVHPCTSLNPSESPVIAANRIHLESVLFSPTLFPSPVQSNPVSCLSDARILLLSITSFLTCLLVAIPASFPTLSFPWRSLKNVNQFTSLPCSSSKAEVKVHSLPQACQALPTQLASPPSSPALLAPFCSSHPDSAVPFSL